MNKNASENEIREKETEKYDENFVKIIHFAPYTYTHNHQQCHSQYIETAKSRIARPDGARLGSVEISFGRGVFCFLVYTQEESAR